LKTANQEGKAKPKKIVRGKWFFLFTFCSSCFLFWWLRSLLIRFLIRLADPVEDRTIAISVLAIALFIAGYLLPTFRRTSRGELSVQLLDRCANLAYKLTIAVSIPALLIAVFLFVSNLQVAYGSADPTPTAFQAVLYVHLFFGFMYLGGAEPEKKGWRPVLIAITLITLPRLIISLHGARFFLAQAAIPVLLIAIARGWIRFSAKRLLQLSAIALFIVFVPSLTRGDQVLGPDNELSIFMQSNILGLFQDNRDLSLDADCPPLLVSLTAKLIPWGAMRVCVIDSGGFTNLPATLERILTNNQAGTLNGTLAGTGSIYLLELYLTGGLFAVYGGSAVFGFTCRRFVGWIGERSLFSGIWAECLTRALFAPRGNLGYVYERIPSLVLATYLVVFIVWVSYLSRHEHAPGTPFDHVKGPIPGSG
jgi:hypothetical protein